MTSAEDRAPKPAGLQQLAARHMHKGAHFMSWPQGLYLAQMRRIKLIETGDAEKSHGRGDLVLQ